jgi:hypothetical protein
MNNLEKFLKYQNHGTSHKRNKGNSGKPKSVRTQTNIDAVQRKLNDNPGASARRNNIPQITKLSFNRFTKHDLNFYPFRMNIQTSYFLANTSDMLTSAVGLEHARQDFMIVISLLAMKLLIR